MGLLPWFAYFPNWPNSNWNTFMNYSRQDLERVPVKWLAFRNRQDVYSRREFIRHDVLKLVSAGFRQSLKKALYALCRAFFIFDWGFMIFDFKEQVIKDHKSQITNQRLPHDYNWRHKQKNTKYHTDWFPYPSQALQNHWREAQSFRIWSDKPDREYERRYADPSNWRQFQSG